jgi:D-alanyl-D-alanine-carboxypeptidase/D-alanyl-D-alanine-endopeptidase
MGGIVEPTQAQLESLVAPYLSTQPSGLGFAIGYASPNFANSGGLYFAGNVQNQFGAALTLDGTTPFEIASVSKTFTATLYALLIRASKPTLTVGDYSLPDGPLSISRTLADITLDQLMNYTSGLPQDNDNGAVDSPPLWPYPYSMPGMMSFLAAAPPAVSPPNQKYRYSNLGFAIMSAILASGGVNGNPRVGAFESKMREYILGPLGMQATFFDEASLAELPLGFSYDYTQSPVYAATSPGWIFFPAYFGAGGIVATPNDMFQWLLFNMGITQNSALTGLLPALQTPSTSVKWGDAQLGLGWFISPAGSNWSASVWKDGDLDGFGSYIAFLPSPNPGVVASQAGAFVLVNADGVTDSQNNAGIEIADALTNDLLLLMQGETPPTDKSGYPRAALSSRQKRAAGSPLRQGR